MLVIKHDDVLIGAKWIAKKLIEHNLRRIYPVPRGGVPVAYAVAGLVPGSIVVHNPHMADVVIDDVIDSGLTRLRHQNFLHFYALVNKHPEYTSLGAIQAPQRDWVQFPWEGVATQSANDIGLRLLQFIGEDPEREGLKDTPARFIKAWKEWTAGYKMSVDGLFKDFADGGENYDEMIIINPIPFYSHCEHHLAAIFGTVHIAYIPNGRIAGLSKFCRLVDVFAKRLQVQERLTVQIANTIEEQLAPMGVGVLVKARHFCMESRGAMKSGVETTTIALRGAIKADSAARAEFLGRVA